MGLLRAVEYAEIFPPSSWGSSDLRIKGKTEWSTGCPFGNSDFSNVGVSQTDLFQHKPFLGPKHIMVKQKAQA